MKHLIENWKTTLAGIVAIIGGILQYHNNTPEAVTGIITGIGLITAKDGNK
jgi:hypothetical protein